MDQKAEDYILKNWGHGWPNYVGRRVWVEISGGDNIRLTGTFEGLAGLSPNPHNQGLQAIVKVDGINTQYLVHPSRITLRTESAEGPVSIEDSIVAWSIEEEHIPVRGNYVCTDDADSDQRDEQELLERLASGDQSAWCVLVVKVVWGDFSGQATLGGYVFPAGQTGAENLVYAQEDFATLQEEALHELNQKVKAMQDQLLVLTQKEG